MKRIPSAEGYFRHPSEASSPSTRKLWKEAVALSRNDCLTDEGRNTAMRVVRMMEAPYFKQLERLRDGNFDKLKATQCGDAPSLEAPRGERVAAHHPPRGPKQMRGGHERNMTVRVNTCLTPEERFNELDLIATQLFGTKRWKVEFCRRYGLTPQTISAWGKKGAPIWAVVALRDALSAQRLETLREAIHSADT